jgi:hypothetical protein
VSRPEVWRTLGETAAWFFRCTIVIEEEEEEETEEEEEEEETEEEEEEEEEVVVVAKLATLGRSESLRSGALVASTRVTSQVGRVVAATMAANMPEGPAPITAMCGGLSTLLSTLSRPSRRGGGGGGGGRGGGGATRRLGWRAAEDEVAVVWKSGEGRARRRDARAATARMRGKKQRS